MSAPSTVTVAAIQAAFSDVVADNLARVTDLCRQAASQGANIVLMPELLEGRYFPQAQREEHFARARPLADHATVAHFSALARELSIVLPVSLFEKDGPSLYNSAVVIDADGRNLGVYRKSHIPDGPGYQEKFYFRPGNTGFRAFSTRYGRIGVGICWDQWFPEAARAMALQGADILLYPTAIGSEPEEPDLDTRDPWQRVMIGHAVANATAVVAANRVGREVDAATGGDGIDFYGSSFIADARGDILGQLDRHAEGVVCASIDIAALQRTRASFGFFRDRRPSLYQSLLD